MRRLQDTTADYTPQSWRGNKQRSGEVWKIRNRLAAEYGKTLCKRAI